MKTESKKASTPCFWLCVLSPHLACVHRCVWVLAPGYILGSSTLRGLVPCVRSSLVPVNQESVVYTVSHGPLKSAERLARTRPAPPPPPPNPPVRA